METDKLKEIISNYKYQLEMQNYIIMNVGKISFIAYI